MWIMQQLFSMFLPLEKPETAQGHIYYIIFSGSVAGNASNMKATYLNINFS